jgi:hypothetical protein
MGYFISMHQRQILLHAPDHYICNLVGAACEVSAGEIRHFPYPTQVRFGCVWRAKSVKRK